jgi:hypothetical protein
LLYQKPKIRDSIKSDTREKATYTKVADAKANQLKNKADMDSGVEAF